MKDVLEKEISGAPVTVLICGSARPLSYAMHNVILYKQQTGDSLFDREVYARIDLKQDPERWLACLWAGLHEQQSDKSWKSPYTLEELGALVDFSNAAEISIAMVKALTAHMPRPKEDESPKVQAPEAEKEPMPAAPQNLTGSGLELEIATASAVTNS
jgi:hypothetical protein